MVDNAQRRLDALSDSETTSAVEVDLGDAAADRNTMGTVPQSSSSVAEALLDIAMGVGECFVVRCTVPVTLLLDCH